MTVLQTRRPFPAWLPPLLAVATIIAVTLVVLALVRRASAPDVPPEPDAFQPPAPVRSTVALDVQQASNGRLTLSDGSADVALRPDVRVEVLAPAGPSDVRVGDWLAVIGIPNEVRNFSIRSLVLIDTAAASVEEGVIRSAAGFAGHEASRDQSERPLLGGRVTAVDATHVSVEGPTGPIAVDLSERAPLFRLSEGRSADIGEGDRIAVPFGSVADADAVLLLPGGAR